MAEVHPRHIAWRWAGYMLDLLELEKLERQLVRAEIEKLAAMEAEHTALRKKHQEQILGLVVTAVLYPNLHITGDSWPLPNGPVFPLPGDVTDIARVAPDLPGPSDIMFTTQTMVRDMSSPAGVTNGGL